MQAFRCFLLKVAAPTQSSSAEVSCQTPSIKLHVSVTVVPRPYFRGHETLLPLLRGKGINRRDRTIVFLALERDEFGMRAVLKNMSG